MKTESFFAHFRKTSRFSGKKLWPGRTYDAASEDYEDREFFRSLQKNFSIFWKKTLAWTYI